MEVRCDKCQARYRVDDARIGPQGLTMRCGKCQNTFKVTRAAEAPAGAPEPAPKPAPAPAAKAPAAVAKPPAGEVGSTMVFGQAPPAAKAAAAALGLKPGAAAAKPGPASKPAPAAAPATEEGAGRTMMFQTGNLKTPAAPKKPEPESGSTMVFGQAPAAAKAAAAVLSRPAAPKGDADAGSTMVFGQSPIAMPKGPATPGVKPGVPSMTKTPATAVKPPAAAAKAPAPEPEPEAPAPEAEAAPEEAAPPQEEAAAPAAEEQAEPAVAGKDDHGEGEPMPDITGETEPPEGGVEAEGAEAAPEEGAFDKAPPKGLLIGVVAGVVVLALVVVGLFVVKKMGHRPPPQAAVDALTAAQAEADKDTLASLAAAEKGTHDSIDQAGPKAYFPQATAQLARIEVQWADALNDQAALLTAKSADDANAPKLQEAAKAKLKAAFDLLAPAVKTDPKSPDLTLALADYYRAQKSNSNMNKFIRNSGAKADDPRVALVAALAAAQEDDGAEKAIPKLKAAAAASPQSARLHFRLAEEYAQMKDDANTRTELAQTLKLSPQHERAKLLSEQLGPAPAQGAAEQK